jgi:hypothetical protein
VGDAWRLLAILDAERMQADGFLPRDFPIQLIRMQMIIASNGQVLQIIQQVDRMPVVTTSMKFITLDADEVQKDKPDIEFRTADIAPEITLQNALIELHQKITPKK